MVAITERAGTLRHLMAGERIVVAPGAADGLTARLVEQAGFPAIYLTGGGIARSFGRPDVGTTTFTEVADRIRSIAAVTTLPLIADLDAGHGGVAATIRAVNEFANAGASAAHLEDREVPKRFSDPGANLIEPTEMVGRIRAAIDGRPFPEFMLIARTDALPALGLDATIDRANRYADAGADAIYVEHIKTVADFEVIARRVAPPKLASLNKGLGDIPTANELQEMGYKLLTLPADAQLAAIRGMQRVLVHIAQHGTSEGFDEMISFADRDAIVGLRQSSKNEEKYLPRRRP